MIDLTDINYVKTLKSDVHATFDTPAGKEVLQFLEKACGWYDSVLTPDNPDLTLINDGKRQVLATIKTILELSPDQIIAMVNKKEGT